MFIVNENSFYSKRAKYTGLYFGLARRHDMQYCMALCFNSHWLFVSLERYEIRWYSRAELNVEV